MSVSIITFADLGERKNLKTIDIRPIIEKFYEKKELSQVICRMQKYNKIPNSSGVVPVTLHYLLKIIEKFVNFFPARNIEEELFDKRASRVIQNTDIAIFHPAFFPRTVKKAKDKNIITVGMAVIAHPQITNHLLKDEYELLKINGNKTKKESRFSHNTPEIAGSFDYIIAFSDFVRDSYVKSGFPLDRIYVAESDPEMKITNSTVTHYRDKIFRVLYVAHTNTLKGLHYLLEAWESLVLENAELILVGGYSYPIPEELRKRYEKIIQLDSSIKWTNFTKNPEKYYQEADLFVFPSLTEGNPRVVMEAMLNGLPIITTENAKSIVENNENGFILPIRDSVAISQKIKFLYDNREVCKNMGKKSREIIINKKPFAEQVFDIYKNILKTEKLYE